ncbi:MAG: hypothetical protein Q4A45_01685 [Clostridia bacterium]|nr:hypothetical protein [Clostridia bacterium]
MTNFEKIKNMSIAEMAAGHNTLFTGACKTDSPTECEKSEWVSGLSPCGQCVFKWLLEEAENN